MPKTETTPCATITEADVTRATRLVEVAMLAFALGILALLFF